MIIIRRENIFKVTQYQPNNCVTSSSLLIDVIDGTKILLDLGLRQDSTLSFKQLYDSNMSKLRSIPYHELTHVIVSHAHYDHVSAVPILAREECDFNGDIIMTELTARLGILNTRDSMKINKTEVAKNNYSKNDKAKYVMYYEEKDIDNVVHRIKCYDYNIKIKLSEYVTVELLPACHMSGASMVLIVYNDGEIERKLLYTGDITYGNKIKRPFTKSIDIKGMKIDYLIMESTYGLRDKEIPKEENPKVFLKRMIVEEVINKNQTLWISSFAIHRSSVLRLLLLECYNELMEEFPILKQIPVYFCGGEEMMKASHDIITDKTSYVYYDSEWVEKQEILNKDSFGPFITTKKDLEHFCMNNGRKIVVSSSGMFDKGYSALLADYYIPNKKVSVLACGYMGEGTLGWSLRNGDEYAVVNGTRKKVRCSFKGVIPSLSGHATHNGLLDFAKSFNQGRMKKIILVHGDDDAKEELKEDLLRTLKNGIDVNIIKQYETIKLQ